MMDFYQKMALVCRSIPKGRVATYGQIALLCEKPKNARQVGHGLKCGLAGEDIPAHRIVNSKGLLAGAAYFDTPDMQKLLLEAESVEVKRTDSGWQVDLKRFGWKNTLEEALALRDLFLTEPADRSHTMSASPASADDCRTE